MFPDVFAAASLPTPFHSQARQLIAAQLLIAQPSVSQLVGQIYRTPILVIGVLDLCLGIAFLVLYLAAPDFKVFRAASIFLGLGALVEFGDYFFPGAFIESVRTIPAIFAVETALEALHIRHRAWARLIWPITAFALTAGMFPSVAFVRPWPILLTQPIFLGIIVIGFRRRNTRDRLIAAAYSGVFLVRATLSPVVQHLTGIRSYFSIRGWEWPLLPGVVTVFGFVTLAIFVRDLIQDRRDKQRLGAELEASRIVQQALIPTRIPQIRGFEIACVYRPFGEVGGDFFQILPIPSGGVLIAIGDVSGKGMPAAMTVSLLIGTLLTLCESTISPAQLLAALNRRAISQANSGFTTCLILHAQPREDSSATLTIANAGHLGPYRNGPQLTPQELILDNGLPLGISASSTYPEVCFELAAGEQLTLLTDGVLEARNPASGELYGFDRTASISAQSAASIADAAQQWGQEDDITVLTIRGSIFGMESVSRASAISPVNA